MCLSALFFFFFFFTHEQYCHPIKIVWFHSPSSDTIKYRKQHSGRKTSDSGKKKSGTLRLRFRRKCWSRQNYRDKCNKQLKCSHVNINYPPLAAQWGEKYMLTQNGAEEIDHSQKHTRNTMPVGIWEEVEHRAKRVHREVEHCTAKGGAVGISASAMTWEVNSRAALRPSVPRHNVAGDNCSPPRDVKCLFRLWYLTICGFRNQGRPGC